jgi:hypothetical protein
MGDVVDLGGTGEDQAAEVTSDVSEMEDAVEDVSQSVCDLWERFGSDAQVSIVTEVDGALVQITVAVELV